MTKTHIATFPVSHNLFSNIPNAIIQSCNTWQAGIKINYFNFNMRMQFR
jgi:hypothetical protein